MNQARRLRSSTSDLNIEDLNYLIQYHGNNDKQINCLINFYGHHLNLIRVPKEGKSDHYVYTQLNDGYVCSQFIHHFLPNEIKLAKYQHTSIEAIMRMQWKRLFKKIGYKNYISTDINRLVQADHQALNEITIQIQQYIINKLNQHTLETINNNKKIEWKKPQKRIDHDIPGNTSLDNNKSSSLSTTATSSSKVHHKQPWISPLSKDKSSTKVIEPNTKLIEAENHIKETLYLIRQMKKELSQKEEVLLSYLKNLSLPHNQKEKNQ